MNEAILNPEVQDFINQNLHINPADLTLKKPIFSFVSNAEIATQIISKKKSEKKLPTWFSKNLIYYPPKINIEQTSSEITAAFKASLVKGKNVFDASGGFGVDTYYFSVIAEKIIHCEINEELHKIAKYNSTLLDRKNIDFVLGDSVSILRNYKKNIDTIFIDPARRLAGNKVFNFSDCEPNILTHLDLFLSKAQRVIIKAAPMLDIKFGFNQLKNVSSIYIVSYKNECKEILYVLDKHWKGNETLIQCVLLKQNSKPTIVKALLESEKQLQITFSNIQKFLYEPDAAILKAGFFKTLTALYPIQKIHVNSHLYTSNSEIRDFPGKTFFINKIMPYQNFEKEKSAKKGNVVSRNFGEEAEKLKKKFKVSESDTQFLIFTTNSENQKILIDCTRINF